MQLEGYTKQNLLKKLDIKSCADSIKSNNYFEEITQKIANIEKLTKKRWDNMDSIIDKFYILITVLIGLQMLSIIIFCIFVS